jgi:AraC-like DNA-binding protein
MENFRQEVSLAQVADLVCMTPEAFCRYFKRVTHRTFFQMLTDYRLRHACRLLAETSQPVAEVAFGSGFGNVSHFNQQFKATLKLTPGQYRRSRVMSYE